MRISNNFPILFPFLTLLFLIIVSLLLSYIFNLENFLPYMLLRFLSFRRFILSFLPFNLLIIFLRLYFRQQLLQFAYLTTYTTHYLLTPIHLLEHFQ